MPRRSPIVVVIALMLLAFGVVAPGVTTATAKTGEETEVVSLELKPRKNALVRVEIHPLLGVAVIRAWLGLRGYEPRTRSGSVEYAAHIPKGPVEGGLDLKVPGVASLVGELITTSPEESLRDPYCKEGGERSREVEFRGSFDFHGGGYLGFHAHRARGSVQRTSAEVCESGRAQSRHRHPDLFAYLPSEMFFSNAEAQVLSSEVRLRERYTSFLARRSRDAPLSSFAAETAEWLPRRVAVRRHIEVAKASGRDFVASSNAEFPESAKVRPPAPFSGSAVFHRGDADARGRGLLTGPLYADIYGVKVSLDAREGVADLFNLNPGF